MDTAGMAVEAGAMEAGAAEATTVTATMVTRAIMVAKGSGAGPWLTDRPTPDEVHSVAGTAGGSEALHEVVSTPAAVSMAVVVSTAVATGRLHPWLRLQRPAACAAGRLVFNVSLRLELPLKPLLRAVINPQDLEALLLYSIDSDIRQRRKQELAGSFFAPDTTTIRPVFQRLDNSIHFANGRLAETGTVLFEVVANVL
jgi:hypothetical protein